MDNIPEAARLRGDYDRPPELDTIIGHRHSANPGCFWVRFSGRDGSILELFVEEVREIVAHFKFSGSALDRLWQVYQWARKNRPDCWLTDIPSHV
ncbi:hypothetical protein [Bradyrhizobium diazoefficiens]